MEKKMPWKEVTSMSEKRKFIELAILGKTKISALCKQFEISRKTGYKLINSFHLYGWEGLKERSRRPHIVANKTPDEIVKLILSTRASHPKWGGEKLKKYLINKRISDLPSEKTIDRILKRHGLITAEESEKRKAWIRFEHKHPNDLWQMDFKGHFQVNQERCHPLTLLDDHSRFSLAIKACSNEDRETVQSHLKAIFREYGLPKRMTMDNGSPWGYSGDQQHTRLTLWLIQQGITVSHSRPGHPQTQGKLERFHRTLKLELLSQYDFMSLSEAQEGFDWWRKMYNEERPHGALELQVPKDRYQKSVVDFCEELPVFEYPRDLITHKVKSGGFIKFKGKNFRVGKSFVGHLVGLKENGEGLVDVYFCHQKVNKLDLRYSCEVE
jgi:transposase InsO family protein